MSSCKLLDGIYSYLVQVTLGALSLSSLLIKRKYFEYPKRSRKVWIYDTSKQVFGALYAHLVNIIIATKIADINQCEWYFINYFFDTFLGVYLTYLFIKKINWFAEKRKLHWLYTGNYDSKDSISTNKKVYYAQLFIWLLIITIVKLFIVYCILIPGKSGLIKFGNFVLGPVQYSTKLELFIVMVVFPLVFNVIQFWVQDNFLKKKIVFTNEIYNCLSEL